MREAGDNWSLEYADGIVIGTFEEEMRMSAFEEEAYPAFERILDEHAADIVGTADLVNIADPFDKNVFEVWEDAAAETAQLPNMERAGIAADGIKAISLAGRLSVPGIEVETFDTHAEAIEWARGD